MAETDRKAGLPYRESVHAAAMLPDSEVLLAPVSNQVVAIALGLCFLVLFLGAAAVALFNIRISLSWIIPVLIVITTGLGVMAVRMINKPWKWNRNGSFSDSTVRLRVVGEGSDTEDVLNEILNDSFEPIVLRSFAGAWLAAGLPPVQPKDESDHKQGARFDERWMLEVQPKHRAESVAITLACIALIVMLHRQVFGTWIGISIPHIFGAIGISMLIRSFTRPEYIRIAPGVLDIFRYHFLGIGAPRVERFDLRTARVIVDLKTGAARIHDTTRPENPVLYLSLRSLLARPRTTAAAIFSAALTRCETPPLPTDALVG